MKGIEKLKSGDWNSCCQEEQADGTIIITLSKRGEGKTHRFKVKHLYQKKEKVLWEEINAE